MSSRIRLGTLYRLELLSRLSFGRGQNGRRVLDVGCHDGYVLSHLNLPVKVGVDLEPGPGLGGLNLVCGDGRFLPFQTGCFDRVYAMDVIEHVLDDGRQILDLIDNVVELALYLGLFHSLPIAHQEFR